MTTFQLKEPPQRTIVGPLDGAMYVSTISAGTQRVEAGDYLIEEPLDECPLDQYGNPVQYYLPLTAADFEAKWEEVSGE